MTELQERQAAAPAAQPAEPAPRPPKRRRVFFVVLALLMGTVVYRFFA